MRRVLPVAFVVYTVPTLFYTFLVKKYANL